MCLFPASACIILPRNVNDWPPKTQRWWIVFLVSIVSCFSMSITRAEPAARIARVSSPFFQVGLECGSGRIVELADLASTRNFVTETPVSGGLWELEFAGNPPNRLIPARAQSCQARRLQGGEPGLRLTWSQFGLSNAPQLAVEVTVRLDRQQASSRWGIEIAAPGNLEVARIRFPRIQNLTQLERERLVVPVWAGLLAEDPRQIFSGSSDGSVRREYDYPGHCSVQCLSFYAEGGPGLSMACDDTAGYRKTFAVFGECAAGLNLEIVHLPERRSSSTGRYRLPYSTTIGTFQGDWYDAAAIYRSWATNQAWARQSRYRLGRVPDWISETSLWVWNRGRSTNVLDAAVVLQGELGLPVSVFWHWWHGCAYDTGFPEYLPPREGRDSFTAALNRAHSQGVRSLVYMNQRLWGMTTASWTNEQAARYAVKSANGQVKPEVYNTFTKLPCATMCLGTSFWREKYAGLAVEAINDLGVDGIYMDQACSSLACFDPAHGHPLGGGVYWMKGFTRLAADIRHRSRPRRTVALAGEGCAENWLPHLDLMLALELSRERYALPDGWEPIPFFQAVYHGYGIFYGNYSSLTLPPYDDLWPAEFAPKEPLQLLDRKFSMQFRLEQARSLIWGQQPTIANFQPSHLRDRAEEMAYVMRLARLRRLGLKYLRDGVMLAPPLLEAPKAEIPISRLSIYAGQREALKESQKTIALALASAWRAADGSTGLVVANISDQVIKPAIILTPARHGLPKKGRIFVLRESVVEPVGEFKGPDLVLEPDLGPLEACLFELRSH